MKLEGKAFIITGGAGSIGGAAARSIIAEGGIAVIFDILSPEDGEKKAKEYHPERAFYFQTDICDPDKVSAACDDALKVIPKGSLFGGVHCAAIAPGRKWDHKLKNSIPFFQKVMHVNSYGTFVVDSCIADAINSQYPDEGPFGPRVTEERGCIINITSVVANPVPARCICYGTSKTAVLGISQGMADFLGPYGIRVNCVSPAVVASALQTMERRPYFLGEMEALCIFPRRLSEAQEVADAIVFLLKNSMMNDTVIKVDGGWRNMSTWGGAADPRSNAISLE